MMEMLAVLLILAIGATMSIDMIASYEGTTRAERAARESIVFARYARNLAMTTGKSAELKVDTASGTFSVYWQSNGSTWDTTPVTQGMTGSGTMSINMTTQRDLANTTMTVTPAGTTAFVYTALGACSTAGTLSFTCGTVSKTVTISTVGDPVLN